MRKSDAEFTDEVFLRSEMKIRKCKAAKRVSFSLVPVAVCMALVMMWQGGLGGPITSEAENTETESANTESVIRTECEELENRVSVQVEKNGQLVFCSEEKAERIVAWLENYTENENFMFEEFVGSNENIDENLESDDSEGNLDDNNSVEVETELASVDANDSSSLENESGIASQRCYEISITDSDGKVQSYKLKGTYLVEAESNKCYLLNQSDRKILLELLEE